MRKKIISQTIAGYYRRGGPTRRICNSSATIGNQPMSSEKKPVRLNSHEVSVTNSESEPESPSWHYDALRQTAQRYECGQEQAVDWRTAKRDLRRTQHEK